MVNEFLGGSMDKVKKNLKNIVIRVDDKLVDFLYKVARKIDKR